ncbi:MAG: glycerate kinase type-2 family protein [Candidatus Saccharicenans sp.]
MDLQVIARRIGEAAISSVKPGRLISEKVKREGDWLYVAGDRFDLRKINRINLLSLGKAGPYLAEAIWPLIEDKLGKAVITGAGEYRETGQAFYYPSAHPLPDEWSLAAGRKAYEVALSSGAQDLFLVLISGGGSAHLCLPEEGLSLDDKRKVTELLLKSGADIKELNTVRKHLSRIKGGRLARAAWPALVVNLVISDVIGNDLENIASGPTFYDSSTFAEALDVLHRRKVADLCPPAVLEVLKEGEKGLREETLKKENKIMERVKSFIIGDNLKALLAAKEEARNHGLESIILSFDDSGEARDRAEEYISRLIPFTKKVREEKRAFCLLAGGELTVTVRGRGKGGRNTEFALACLLGIKKRMAEFSGLNWLVMSLGTDGRDGNTDSAGAYIVNKTLGQMEERKLRPEEFLNDNDSYGFFERVGGLLFTGPTGTNVMDIRVFLLAPRDGD